MLPSNGAARCCERFPLPSVARRHACQPPSWNRQRDALSPSRRRMHVTAHAPLKASAVVPSLPWTVRRRSNAQSTPGGTRTRSFRIESPASFRFDHRGVRNFAEPDIRTETSNVPMPALPASAAQGQIGDDTPIEVIMARRSRAGLRSAKALTAGLEPALRD